MRSICINKVSIRFDELVSERRQLVHMLSKYMSWLDAEISWSNFKRSRSEKDVLFRV